MTDRPEQPTTRRLAYDEKREFARVFEAVVRRGNEGEFRLVLQTWRIEKGSSEWLWAWQRWDAEREAERDARKQRGARKQFPSKRGASRRDPPA
jgi:hypothetical protein